MSDADLWFGPSSERVVDHDGDDSVERGSRRGARTGRVVLLLLGALVLVAGGFVAGRQSAPDAGGVDVATGDTAEGAAPDEGSTTTVAPMTTTEAPPPKDVLSPDDQVQLDRVGPVAIGMTLDEGSEAAGQEIVGRNDSSPGGLSSGCYFAAPTTGSPAVSFMVIDDVIARIDVGTAGVTTLSGVGVGSTTTQVIEAYGSDRIAVETHPYDETGQYLRFLPRLQSELSLIFETDGMVVTSYRSGDADAVAAIEGCA